MILREKVNKKFAMHFFIQSFVSKQRAGENLTLKFSPLSDSIAISGLICAPRNKQT